MWKFWLNVLSELQRLMKERKTPLMHKVSLVCFLMHNQRLRVWSLLIFEWQITFFSSQNLRYFRGSLFDLYYQNSSPLLVTKWFLCLQESLPLVSSALSFPFSCLGELSCRIKLTRVWTLSLKTSWGRCYFEKFYNDQMGILWTCYRDR